jgi:hypothetical protein
MPNPSLQPTCYGLRPSHAAELKRYADGGRQIGSALHYEQ